jgi:hypothetical protein
VAEKVASTLAATAMANGLMEGVVVGAVDESGVSGTIQSPICWHLWPQTIVLPGYTIVYPIFIKVTVQPALHIVTTESSKCEARPGMMWADRAPGSNVGRLSVHVCIECMRLLFGRWAMMGMVVGRMLVAGVLVVRKWLVALESSIAHHLMVLASMLIVLSRIEATKV